MFFKPSKPKMLKKLGFPTFSPFFNFSTKKSWPQRLSLRKVEKVGKVAKTLEKPTVFKPSKPKKWKKLVFLTFSTFLVSSFLMENVQRLGFRALIMENVDGLSVFNMLGRVLDWF